MHINYTVNLIYIKLYFIFVIFYNKKRSKTANPDFFYVSIIFILYKLHDTSYSKLSSYKITCNDEWNEIGIILRGNPNWDRLGLFLGFNKGEHFCFLLKKNISPH